MKKNRVVVFGIFDGVHDGHRSLFSQARAYGNELIAIVGRDAISEQIKKKTPRHSEAERRELVEKEPLVDRAVLGDPVLSSYHILRELEPDSICLGYDQEAFQLDLEQWLQRQGWEIPIRRLQPWRPDTYHNSLLS